MGAIITDLMGAQAPAGLPRHPLQHARHSSTRRVEGNRVQRARAGDPRPTGLSADESRAYEQLSFFFMKGIGYGVEMGLRPQTALRTGGLTRRPGRLDDRP